jgi:hypothetical protein
VSGTTCHLCLGLHNLGRKLQEASADSGYLSEASLAALEARGIRAYIAAGWARHPAAAKRRLGGELTKQAVTDARAPIGRRSLSSARLRST